MMKFQMFSTLVALVLLASNAVLAIPQDYGYGGYGDGGDGAGGADFDFIEGPPTWHKRADDLPKAWNTSSERAYNSLSK